MVLPSPSAGDVTTTVRRRERCWAKRTAVRRERKASPLAPEPDDRASIVFFDKTLSRGTVARTGTPVTAAASDGRPIE